MSEAETPDGGSDPVIIKKYANRRLYNTATSKYVTLEQLSQMVRAGQDFTVYDAKSGDDITRSVLTQIIFEEEGKGGQTLLPVNFLRQLIGMYGNAMQPFVPNYLENVMETFQKNQEAIKEQFTGVLSKVPGLKPFEDIAKQNIALVETAMQRFTPFAMGKSPGGKARDAAPASGGGEVAELRARIDAMQELLERMAKGNKD
ncbi:MAG: polyhydroxyalkanoate synthesis repressor PhaR [Alphaproteobacteria bacterium]|nr:polyhydroxyalkanoate synthesis repressor PhaR [Alphaproteobacteria bacterium]